MKNLLPLLVLIISLFFIGNSKAEEGIISPITIIKEFKEMTGLDTGEVKFYFRKSLKKYDETGNAIGICQTSYNPVTDKTLKKVVFNKTWWYDKTKTNDQRRVVALHEIGHCVLYIGHKDGEETLFSGDYKVIEGCPTSLMRSHAWSSKEAARCFTQFKQLYIKRMLNQVLEELERLKNKLNTSQRE